TPQLEQDGMRNEGSAAWAKDGPEGGGIVRLLHLPLPHSQPETHEFPLAQRYVPVAIVVDEDGDERAAHHGIVHPDADIEIKKHQIGRAPCREEIKNRKSVEMGQRRDESA